MLADVFDVPLLALHFRRSFEEIFRRWVGCVCSTDDDAETDTGNSASSQPRITSLRRRTRLSELARTLINAAAAAGYYAECMRVMPLRCPPDLPVAFGRRRPPRGGPGRRNQIPWGGVPPDGGPGRRCRRRPPLGSHAVVV